jgi:hypothetical protein
MFNQDKMLQLLQRFLAPCQNFQNYIQIIGVFFRRSATLMKLEADNFGFAFFGSLGVCDEITVISAAIGTIVARGGL